MSFGGGLIHSVRIWCKRFLPSFVVNAIRSPKRYLQSKKKAQRRKNSPLISLERLVSDIKSSGIGPGDIIMVHSSLSRIGNVTGSAETVIKSCLDVVTDEGTVIMPCFNSAEQVVKDMKSGKQLDLRDMKSATGIITETFRTQSGVCRSSHPFSSVCAWGKQAEYIVSRHATHEHVCHENSPVGRLVELNGKVVGIGIPIAQGLGVAHYLEDTWDIFPFNVHTSILDLKLTISIVPIVAGITA